MSYLSQNFDLNNVFEFLRLSAQDPDNTEPMLESYWIIVYLYLKKLGFDILDSFRTEKSKQLL